MYDNAGNRVTSTSGTRDLMKTYPSSIRAWIARNGGLKPSMTYLRGRALAAIVTSCDIGSHAASAVSSKRSGAIKQKNFGKGTARASIEAR